MSDFLAEKLTRLRDAIDPRLREAIDQLGHLRLSPRIASALAEAKSESPLRDIARAVESASHLLQETGECLQSAEQLGDYGWTIPISASLPDTRHLLRSATSAEAADAAFVEFYSKDDAIQLVALFVDLLRQPHLADYHFLLDEVQTALDLQLYRLTVPALLATFEAVMRRCWTQSAWSEKPRNAHFAKRRDLLHPDSVELLFLRATQGFVTKLYARNNESDPKPLTLNRHWILHGRGPADATFADSLRLLQAIRTVLEDDC